MVDSSLFPKALKLAHITTVSKKASKNSKENYRPVSILPDISKIYKRCMCKQISDYLGNFFSKFQCGVSPRYQCAALSSNHDRKKKKEKQRTKINSSYSSW